jgi:hypothetical protein
MPGPPSEMTLAMISVNAEGYREALSRPGRNVILSDDLYLFPAAEGWGRVSALSNADKQTRLRWANVAFSRAKCRLIVMLQHG